MSKLRNMKIITRDDLIENIDSVLNGEDLKVPLARLNKYCDFEDKLNKEYKKRIK